MIKQCLILFISNIIFWIQRIGARAYTNRHNQRDLSIQRILRRFASFRDPFMENSKKGNIPLQQGVVLSKNDCPATKEQREYMSKVLYASAIRSIM